MGIQALSPRQPTSAFKPTSTSNDEFLRQQISPLSPQSAATQKRLHQQKEKYLARMVDEYENWIEDQIETVEVYHCLPFTCIYIT